MAVDIAEVCKVASENQSGQELAIWLCIMFSVYTVVSIALSALTIYTSSQVGPPGATSGRPPVLKRANTFAYAGGDGDHEGPDGIPLVAIPGMR
tara:strand:- start:51 stop:332 length:282 start_codon:yes stop_codon:yes gene_type:complete